METVYTCPDCGGQRWTIYGPGMIRCSGNCHRRYQLPDPAPDAETFNRKALEYYVKAFEKR